ncbi:MAG: SAM-dependent methyltransferase [Parcubacteria group bacterium Gr01-1014_8]|nr:MAG: SAM-dependent methyltransferase [Parcubacteria group bacterium Gr01-1014_8]
MDPVDAGVASHESFAHPHRNVAVLGVQPGMKVADFGAGSGAYVHAITDALSGTGTVYAIDVQKDLLRRIKNDATKRGFHNVEVVWADLEKLGASKIKEQVLDLVLISNVLFQLHDKHVIFEEAKRILKKGGRLAVIDWSDSYGGIGPTKSDVMKKEDAIKLARRSGFELPREFQAGAHHYGLIFRVKMGS